MRKIQQLKILLQDYFDYRKLCKKKPNLSNSKTVFVNFDNPNLYHRFFYLLLKFYQLEGYQIIYPMSFSKFRNLRNGESYLSLIVKEYNFLFIDTIKPEGCIEISDKNFSANYFKKYFNGNEEANAYHIPMSFHPLMYSKNLWKEDVPETRTRVNSIFCYGNFDEKVYTEIDATNFHVLNRVKMFSICQKLERFHSLSNQKDLETLITNKPHGKIVFAIKDQFNVPIEKVRAYLSEFNFFLCCPGVVMPLCHNFVEAMSVGTIPVIQRQYAEVIYPNLKNGENAILFEDQEELERLLNNDLFSISKVHLKSLSENAKKYYQEFLTPTYVVKKINESVGKSMIYLNAEHRSVNFKN